MPQNMAGGVSRIISPRELDVVEGAFEIFKGFLALSAKEVSARTEAWRKAHDEREAALTQIEADKAAAVADREKAEDAVTAAKTTGQRIVLSAQEDARTVKATTHKDVGAIRAKADARIAEAVRAEAKAEVMGKDAAARLAEVEKDEKALETGRARLKADRAKLATDKAALAEVGRALDIAVRAVRKE